MPYIPPVTSPNIEKLLGYLNKSQWHNVSSHFSSYVRKEYDSLMDRLHDDEAIYRNLTLMIEYSEMGRFSEAKHLVDEANKEHQDLINRLTELALNQSKVRKRKMSDNYFYVRVCEFFCCYIFSSLRSLLKL